MSQFDRQPPITARLIKLREEKSIQNRIEQLEKQSFIDPLTGLYNRRYLDQQIKNFSLTGDINLKGLTVLMLDVDNLKEVNELPGEHFNGDKLLCQVGATIKNSIQATDVGARYGGDEFTILLPNMINEDDVQNFILRLESSFHDQNLHVSFGHATSVKEDPKIPINFEPTLREADAKLKKIKLLKGLLK